MNKIKIAIGVLLIAILCSIFFWYQGYCKKVDNFNKLDHTNQIGVLTEYVNLDAIERTGKSDTWLKPSPINNDDGNNWITAKIYDMSIEKVCRYDVTDWTIQINVKNSMYINNAWCGTVEIHQFVDGKENVQTLDLRNLVVDEITLKYYYDGQDVLIPLERGDFIIYHPSTEVFEMPIISEDYKTKAVIIGLIVYFEDSIDLSDVTISYHIKKDVKDGMEYNLFRILLIGWGIIVALFIFALFSTYYTQKKLERNEKLLVESLSVFSSFVDAKDPYTSGHSKRVADYSKLIAERLKMSTNECKEVYYIALMHDCGKCTIPDAILNKPARLTDEEYEIIKKHTTEGAKMLEGFSAIKNFSDGALYHHERFDGKGYPLGVAGTDIPLIGRIICVADAFDAMASKRVYRDAFDMSFIREELIRCSGTQFDPKIVEIVVKLLDEGKFME